MASTIEDLHATQKAFVQLPDDQDGTLLGAPGTGKTRALVARARRLGGGLCCLLLAPRRPTADALLRCVAAASAGSSTTTTTGPAVRTVLSLAVDLVTPATTLAKHTCPEAVVHRARRECRDLDETRLRRQVPVLQHVRSILVDAAEDLTDAQYALIRQIATLLRASLVLAGDPRQTLGPDRGAALLRHPGVVIRLTKHFRLCPALAALLQTAWANGETDPPTSLPPRPLSSSSGTSSRQPCRLLSADVDTLARDLVDTVRAAWAARLSVAVLGPVVESFTAPNGRVLTLGLQWAERLLRAHDLPCHASSTGVHVLTAEQAKGREFDVVVALNVHHAALGRLPADTAEELRWRRMWHVIWSRARTRLIMYRVATSNPWPALPTAARRGLLATLGTPLEAAPEASPAPAPATQWLATDVLGRSPALCERIQRVLDLDLKRHGSPGDSRVTRLQRLCRQWPTRVAMWAQQTFFHAYRDEAPPCLVALERVVAGQMQHVVDVTSATQMRRVQALRERLGFTHPVADLLLDLDALYACRQQVQEAGLDDVLEQAQAQAAGKRFLVYRYSALGPWDLTRLERACRQWRTQLSKGQPLSLLDMWHMCTWVFRLQAGTTAAAAAADAAGPDDADVHRILQEDDQRLRHWAAEQADGLLFQQVARLPHLPLRGIVDVVQPSAPQPRVMHLVFDPEAGPPAPDVVAAAAVHAEMCFYHQYQQHRPANSDGPEVHVWNLCTGARHAVKVTTCPQRRWQLYAGLAAALNTRLTDTAWLYDLETTGLDTATCGIIDLHVQEATSGLVPVSTLVHQADVPAAVVALTGIRSADLQTAPPVAEVMRTLTECLERCAAPALLAHYGTRYDHLVLRRFLPLRLQAAVRWGDTFQILPVLCPAATPGPPRQLGLLYEAYFQRPYHGPAHRAAADVDMMQRLVHHAQLDSPALRTMCRDLV